MNKCMFTGRLVRNPEAKVRRRKKDDSKFLVVTFTLAIGDDDDTDYLCFKIMNASAETFNQYVKKGMKVIISDARAKYEKYTVDGEEKEKVVFNVYQWEFAETKRKSSVSEDDDYIEEDYVSGDDESDDDGRLNEKKLGSKKLGSKKHPHISELLKPKKSEASSLPDKVLWDGFTKEERLILYEQGLSKEYIDNYEKTQKSTLKGQREMLEYRKKLMSAHGFVPADDEDVPFEG